MQISDILIHVDNSLASDERGRLEEKMRALPGVIAPRFNPGREHLLLVAFDPDRIGLPALLETVRAEGYRAQLIGA